MVLFLSQTPQHSSSTNAQLPRPAGAYLAVHEDNQIISEAMTTIAL